MSLKFCSFASSSSGNCYLVESDTTRVLVDVGIAGKRIIEGLKEKDIEPDNIDGILITHEHIDHVKSVRMISKKADKASVYATKGTADCICDKVPMDRFKLVKAGESFTVGDIQVNPFNLSHDAAEPVGYSFSLDGRKLSIVTDTGYVTEEIFQAISKSNTIILEANHEINILKMGSYPYSLKQRILGKQGHLSNEAAGECIKRILRQRQEEHIGEEGEIPRILLAHLSSENNTPSQAYLTIRNILFEDNFFVGKDLEMNVVHKDQCSDLLEV